MLFLLCGSAGWPTPFISETVGRQPPRCQPSQRLLSLLEPLLEVAQFASFLTDHPRPRGDRLVENEQVTSRAWKRRAVSSVPAQAEAEGNALVGKAFSWLLTFPSIAAGRGMRSAEEALFL